MVIRSFVFAAVAVCALAAAPALVQGADERSSQWLPGIAVGVTGGTLGVGVEASFKLTEFLVLRAGASGFSWDSDGTSSGISYNWSSDIKSAGLVADLHPFGNGFRLSAGARYLNLDFAGDAQYAVTYLIGDETYLSADIGGLRARHSVQKLAPYAGVGFDAAQFGSGFAIGVDLGFIYLGDVDATLTSERGVVGLADDLAAEADKLLDGAWYKQLYPVAMASFKYRF